MNMVVARYAAGCDARRLEALAQISENPVAARDLTLLNIILCGYQAAGTKGAREAYAICWPVGRVN